MTKRKRKYTVMWFYISNFRESGAVEVEAQSIRDAIERGCFYANNPDFVAKAKFVVHRVGHGLVLNMKRIDEIEEEFGIIDEDVRDSVIWSMVQSDAEMAADESTRDVCERLAEDLLHLSDAKLLKGLAGFEKHYQKAIALLPEELRPTS